jgi:hypothetical protein
MSLFPRLGTMTTSGPNASSILFAMNSLRAVISRGVRGSERSISCLRESALLVSLNDQRREADLALSPVQMTKSTSSAHSFLSQSKVMFTSESGESQSLQESARPCLQPAGGKNSRDRASPISCHFLLIIIPIPLLPLALLALPLLLPIRSVKLIRRNAVAA